MRNQIARLIAGFAAVLAFLPPAMAQNTPLHGVPQGGANVYKKLGNDPGGPAPSRDLAGVWAGGGGTKMAAPP
jgi:hypothetical protein